ncbi:MAG: hypothetical protein ACP5GU_04375 [Thermoprotei archaeon]|jgi:hypothetical protein
MNMKKNIILIIIILESLILIKLSVINIVQAINTLGGPFIQRIYASWQNTNDWLIVEAYAVIDGESYLHVLDPYSTVLTHQAITYGINKDPEWRFAGCYYFATTQGQNIRVEIVSSQSVRITDPYAYDNENSGSVNEYLQYALDTLWNFITSYAKLPLPSPWGLILQSSPKIEIQRDQNLRGATFYYNRNPTLQGADWLWYIDKPVQRGWYLIDVHARGEAGLTVYCPDGGFGFLRQGDIDVYLTANFYVDIG